jgi:hypothetical protein
MSINKLNFKEGDVVTQEVFDIIDVNMTNVQADIINNTNQLTDIENRITWISVKEKVYGAKGDRTTDDTIAIQNALDMASVSGGGTIYFPQGVYLISSKLIIDGNCSLILDNDAVIRATSSMDCMIGYNLNGSNSHISRNRIISGGKLDGNNLVNDLLQLAFYIGLDLHNVIFYNFKRYGLHTQAVTGSSAELIGNKLYFRNQNVALGAIAIYNLSNDNHFNDIVILDVETAMVTNFVKASKIHSWISLVSLIPNSTFVSLLSNAGGSSFTDCYSDTLRYTFKTVSSSASAISIRGLNVLWNKIIYTDALATTYSPIIFKGDTNMAYNVSGSTFNISLINTYFCEVALSSTRVAIFRDCFVEINSTGTIINYTPTNYEFEIAKSTTLLKIGTALSLYTDAPCGEYLIGDISMYTGAPSGASGVYILEVAKTPTFYIHKLYPQPSNVSGTSGFIYYRFCTPSNGWFTSWNKVATITI